MNRYDWTNQAEYLPLVAFEVGEILSAKEAFYLELDQLIMRPDASERYVGSVGTSSGEVKFAILQGDCVVVSENKSKEYRLQIFGGRSLVFKLSKKETLKRFEKKTIDLGALTDGEQIRQ